MKNKKSIIIITMSVLVLLAIAPWMNKQTVHDRVFNEKAKIDGSINKKTGELVCDYDVSWFPFGRIVSSCEGGYFVPFFYIKKGSNDNAQKQQIHENNKVAIEIAGWKTYRNDEYGFEFKYPSSLIAENYGAESDEIIVGIALSTKKADFQIPFIELEIIPQPVKFLINDSIERLTDVKTYKAIVNQEINIGGLKGKEIGNGGFSDTEYSVYREIFVGLKENKSLFIKYVGLEKTTLDTILSTFKFTE